MRPNPLRAKLKAGKTTFGMWVTVESPNVTEAAVTLGMDWVVIEMEHGHLSWADVLNHLRALNGSQTAGLVRVPELRRETIQRGLDLGADGLIVPMVGSAEMVQQALSFARYPPQGVRGVSGERCVRWGLEKDAYLAAANSETMIIPLLETREACENFDAILEIPDIDAYFFGPADMSASHGYLGEWEGGSVGEKLATMCRRAAERGIASGVLARHADDACHRRSQGFRMIGLGVDISLMIQSTRAILTRLDASSH